MITTAASYILRFFDQRIATFRKLAVFLLCWGGGVLLLDLNLKRAKTNEAAEPLATLAVCLKDKPKLHYRSHEDNHVTFSAQGYSGLFMISDDASHLVFDNDSIKLFVQKLAAGDTVTVYAPRKKIAVSDYIPVRGICSSTHPTLLLPAATNEEGKRSVAATFWKDTALVVLGIGLLALMRRRNRKIKHADIYIMV